MTGSISKLGKNEHQVWKFIFVSSPFSSIVHNSQNSNCTASKTGEEREHDPQKFSKSAFSENRSKTFFSNLRKTDLKNNNFVAQKSSKVFFDRSSKKFVLTLLAFDNEKIYIHLKKQKLPKMENSP